MDVVCTLPKRIGLRAWVDEGQLPGEPWNGLEYHFYRGGYAPPIRPGERVYIVYDGRLIGYAPLVRVARPPETTHGFALVRRGGAVAVTIDEHIPGFRGWRYRWWRYEDERPYPDWMGDLKTPLELWVEEGSGWAG